MNLVRRLGNQKQATRNQNNVVPGEQIAPKSDDRFSQAHHPCEREQQRDPKQQSKTEAELSHYHRAPRLEPRDQHRDEHHIVDTEHDLERRQRQKREPCIRIGEEIDHDLSTFAA